MLVSSEPRPDSATTATPALTNHDDLVAQRVGGFLAYLLAVTLPIQLPGFRSVSIGFAFTILLLPTIVPVVVRMVYGRALTRTALLVLIAAPFVTAAALALDDSRSFSSTQAILSTALFLGLVLQICGVAWACSIIGIQRVALLYSVGAIFNAAIQP